MRKLRVVALMLALCCGLISCTGSDESNATKVADNFLDAFLHSKVEVMKQVAAPSVDVNALNQLIDLMQTEGFEVMMSAIKGYQVLGVEITGDDALVTYSIEGTDGTQETQHFPLMKKDGKWYVNFAGF
ncbi:MAG: DUF4878 domain-containing protein [Rikenellaceae bacterium]